MAPTRERRGGARRSEDWYRSLFSTSLDGILVTDLDGLIEDANPALLAMLGYGLDELRSLSFQHLTAQKWAAEDRSGLGRFFPAEPSYGLRSELIRRDRSAVPVMIRGWVVEDEHGRPSRLAAIVRDITETRRTEEQSKLADALHTAISREELELRFQPIVCLQTGEIAEFEALIRWRHPQRGLLSPDVFIPLAEQTSVIEEIDEWVLREACRQAWRWRPRFGDRRIAVNISSRHFTRIELISLIDEVLTDTGLGPESLCVEVTENAMIDQPDSAAEVLASLKKRGVSVSLDDFGTGYSSLSYLHRFTVDTLKIDRSFVSGAGQKSEIIGAIVLLAHSLGMAVIAEGVENPGHLARVRELGCEFAQGYYFSRPVDAEAAGDLLTARPAW